MKILFRVIILVSISCIVRGQTCNCLQEFNYVKSYFETNSPSFNSFTSQQLKDYKTKSAAIRDRILKKKPDTDCIFYLQQYTRLLRDNHSTVEQAKFNLVNIDENDSIAVAQVLNSELYKRQKPVTLSNEQLEKIKNSSDPVEGIYTDSKNDFKIAIVKNENSQKDYRGIVLETTSKIWKWGFIKMELSRIKNDLFNISMYTKSFQRVCGSSTIRDGNIYNFGWSKINPVASSNMQPFGSEIINDSIYYLRVSSFDAKYFSALDSFYSANRENIPSRKHLIIDLRNNGGGSEACYAGLLQYIYTRPINLPNVEVFSTAENKKRYLDRIVEMKYEKGNFSDDEINSTNSVLQLMMSSGKKGFISLNSTPTEPLTLKDLPKYPENVVVLQNSLTASSAEAFILKCQQSGKVTTMGENTGGYLGFGNVFETKTPGGCFKILNTTTRYKEYYKYELKGIPPEKYLVANSDWIAEAIKSLKK